MSEEPRSQAIEEGAQEEAVEEGPSSPAPEENVEPLAAVDTVEPVEPVEHDLAELIAKARERDEYLALAQRTQADFENFRKRKSREVSDAEGRGVARLAKELLPALDSLDLALGHMPEEAAKGVGLVQDELAAALARAGIEGFSPQGERFDPNEHEAMSQRPVEGAEPGTVAEVFQRGYRLNGTVLRPARVVVAE